MKICGMMSSPPKMSIMSGQRTRTVSRLLGASELQSLIVDSFRNEGANVVVLDTSPLKISVAKGDWQKKLIIYIWNVTHGGKTRSSDEYRIQMKGKGLEFETGFSTLLLGWFNEEGVFAAFSAKKHGHYGKSPSVQVSLHTMREAKAHGIAFHTKFLKSGTQEIVVAFQQNYIIEYVANVYHEYHEVFKTLDESELKTLEKPLDEKLPTADLARISDKRRSIVITLNRKVRSAKFRRDVFTLYSGRCAMCGIQGRLTEAAHIIPVNDDGSDEICNGVLLCRNHHRAFDLGLLAIRGDYKIVLNRRKLNELRKDNQTDQLASFLLRSRLNRKINLPERPEHYPKSEYLKENYVSKNIL